MNYNNKKIYLFFTIFVMMFAICSCVKENNRNNTDKEESAKEEQNVNNNHAKDVENELRNEKIVKTKQLIIGYWHNFDNGSVNIKLSEVSLRYDVINIAFAETIEGTCKLEFTPYNATKEEFKSDIQSLQQKGKKVLLSIGGQNGHIKLSNDAQTTEFINSLENIIDTYGFDGIDIDLEGASVSLNADDKDFKNPTTIEIVNLIKATKTICKKYGKNFIVTMAPETAYVQGGMTTYTGIFGAYLPIIYALKDKLTYIHVQHYNCGSAYGLDGKIYETGTADFHVAMAEVLLQGFPVAGDKNNMFPALKPSQVAIGVAASLEAASSGYTEYTILHQALQYLVTGKSYHGSYKLINEEGYSDFRGIMTWSINWDSRNGYKFAVNMKDIFVDFLATTTARSVSTGNSIDSNNTSVPKTNPEVKKYKAWNAETEYKQGDRVSYKGQVYEAQWWTKNEKPKNELYYVWVLIAVKDENGYGEWNEATSYLSGTIVTYKRKKYIAGWWNTNCNPEKDTSGAWTLVK